MAIEAVLCEIMRRRFLFLRTSIKQVFLFPPPPPPTKIKAEKSFHHYAILS